MKQHSKFSNLYVSEHPLVADKLTRMRDKKCSKTDFKLLLAEITFFLGYEITRDMPTATKFPTR